MLKYSRRRNDDLSIHQLFVELGVLAFFVRCSDQGMTLLFKPFSDTELVLGGS